MQRSLNRFTLSRMKASKSEQRSTSDHMLPVEWGKSVFLKKKNPKNLVVQCIYKVSGFDCHYDLA